MSRDPALRIRGQALEDIRRASRLLVGVRARHEAHLAESAALLKRHHPQVVSDYWRYNKVVLLATSRAREAGVEHPIWDALEAEYAARARTQGAIQELTALKVTRILAREGIRSVSIKGPLMARQLYGDVALRDPSNDVDVLVDVARLGDASALLEAHGWRSDDDPLLAGSLPELHYAFWAPPGTPHVELHWRIQWYETSEQSLSLLTDREVKDGTPVPDVASLLQTLLLCFARDGFHRLRLAADIAAWWDRYGNFETLRSSPRLTSAIERPIEHALRASERVVGTPGPDSEHTIRACFATATALDDRPMTTRESFSQVALVDVLNAPPQTVGLRFATTWLRSEDFLRWRYPGWSRFRMVKLLRLIYAVRTSSHVGRFLMRSVATRLRRNRR